MPEGRQSPSPEGQSGRQLQDPTGSGTGGLGKTEYKDPKSQLDNLVSNPKPITEDILKEKFAKGFKKE
ncbi:hypothetical protein CEP51_013571 [Fusarium floridanum]|nr:hypothetical protein CEP51_013571 [Fusarium floridanum]RSM08824.1 hypothetical protein CDV31_007963 [Fusarium ambrosium]UPK91599.1 hypothetical protein LCI18_002534 [Fusarium solani-melongenae]